MSTENKPLPYRCCVDWEHSQYDDSDWYCVAYDPETDSLLRVLTGSTRFPGLNFGQSVVQPMTPEMQVKATAALENLYFSIILKGDRLVCEQPDIKFLTSGTAVRFSEAYKCMKKETTATEEKCNRCTDNPGKWINPRNTKDVRDCLRCSGTGKVQLTSRHRVKTDGKQEWEKIEAGTKATVLGQTSYGKFYRKGYNQPDRDNTTVYLRLEDGREVQATASKLRLDREPMPEAEAREKARNIATAGDFYPPFATARTSML